MTDFTGIFWPMFVEGAAVALAVEAVIFVAFLGGCAAVLGIAGLAWIQEWVKERING